MKTNLLRTAPLLLLLPIANVEAGPTVFSDTAPVVAVEPITEMVYQPERRRECTQRLLEALPQPIAGTIGEDIRRQLRPNIRTETDCYWVEEQTLIERLTGYRVTYVYGGREFVRRMDQAPGNHVPVRIALEPVR